MAGPVRFLPVVARELRVRARLATTRYMRVGAASVVLIFGWLVLWPMSQAGTTTGTGQVAYVALSSFLLVFCLVEGIRVAAGLIVEERRDGTLGLLFLTPLSATEVLLGKLAGAALTAGYSLVATVPVLAFTVLLGGVTGGEMVRGAWVLVNALALAMAAGTWASVRARDGAVAMVLALGAVGGLCIVPILLDGIWQWRSTGSWSWSWTGVTLSLVSPLTNLYLAQEATYQTSVSRFWIAQVLQPAAACLLIAFAAARLRRSWRDESEPRRTMSLAALAMPGPMRGDALKPESIGAPLFWTVPLHRWIALTVGLELVAAFPMLLLTQWTASGGAAWVVTAIAGVPAILAGLAAVLIVIYIAARSLSEAKDSGELEMLLTTPLGDQELVRRLWRRLRGFAVALTVVEVVMLIVPWVLAAGRASLGWLQVIGHAALGVANWFGWCACIHVALWFALTSRRLTGAVVKTFLLVVIGPAMIVTLVSGGLVAFSQWSRAVHEGLSEVVPAMVALAIQLGWLRWAQTRLMTSFRPAAAGSWVVPMAAGTPT